MSSSAIAECPPSLKAISHYLKTAAEHESRDIVVAYWCRLYAMQTGLKIDRSTPEAIKLLASIMDWLEKTKEQNRENEAIIHDIPAQAHLENYALKLFLWADSQDRAAIFNKNVVKSFYVAALIYDVLETFGELTDECQQNRKYAKWKAAHIHGALKNGEQPTPGPMVIQEDNTGFTAPDYTTPEPSANEKPAPNTDIEPKEPNDASTPPPDDETALPSLPTPPEQQNPDPLSPPVDYKVPSPPPQTGIQLTPVQISSAQKYCKWASSALNYDDVTTAITNLQKALNVLQTGEEE